MKLRKVLSLLLFLALLLSMISACGTTPAATSNTVASAEQASSAPAEPATEALPAVADDTATEEILEISIEETISEEETIVEYPPIAYPFAEEMAFSVFCPADSMAYMLMTQMGLSEDWSNIPTLSYVYESVNFSYEFITCAENARSEQFNLMIASGDWTDFFESSLYTGGATQAYNEGVIIDLTDLVPQNMPDYWALLQQQSAADQSNLYNDEKQILSINDISGTVDSSSGLLVRQDMLLATGMDVPTTIDALQPVLAAVYNLYGTEQTFYVGTDGIMSNVIGAFDCSGFDISASTADPGFFLKDGTVESSLLSKNYYNYLVYFKELYDQGLIYQDFYSAVVSAASMNALSLGGAFIWNGDGGLIDSMTATGKAALPEYELVGIGAIEAETGAGYHYASELSTVAQNGTCISATCKNPEEALQVLNWYFTEAGQTFCVWGVEDLTYTALDGQNTFTEAITDGFFPVNLMYGFYIWAPGAVYIDKSVLYDQYSDAILNAYGVWGEADSTCILPSSLSLTSEESEAYTTVIGDICTIASEQILKWILGEEALTPETFSILGETLKQTGIDECLDIYQAAYDRYATRLA